MEFLFDHYDKNGMAVYSSQEEVELGFCEQYKIPDRSGNLNVIDPKYPCSGCYSDSNFACLDCPNYLGD